MIDQHASLSEKFIKKWIWLYIFSFIIAPIGYIIKIIISGQLTVSEVGIIYGIISLIIMLSAYNDVWMSESINHFVPKFVTEKRYDKIKSILLYAIIAQMATWITIAFCFLFFADFIALEYFESSMASSVLKVFAFYFIGINITQVLSMFFISIQNTFQQKIVEFIRIIFTLFFTIWVLFFESSSMLHYSYAWLSWVYISVVVAIIVFYIKYYKKYFQNEKIIFEKEFIVSIFRYWFFVFLGAQAWVVLSQIDMQMVIYILGTTDAWYYTNYLSIIWIPFIVIAPIFGLLFPVFSEMHSKWENTKITLVKEIFTNNFLILGSAINIFFFTFALPITYVLFWSKFITSGYILQYSILFLIFNFILQINFNILAGIGQVSQRAKIIGQAVILNIITNVIFIYFMWVYWAAIATWLGWIYIWYKSENLLKQDYKIEVNWKLFFKNNFILWCLSIIVLLIFWNFDWLFSWFTRSQWFFLMLWVSVIYFFIFYIINYSTFQNFILEIKRLRNKKV